MSAFFLYVCSLLALTLGTVTVCGLAVRLCSRLFSRISGSGSSRVFDATAMVGTPVHEAGHAVMCLLFGHKITGICLWSPTAKNGMYGYVEHSYNRKNPWALLGNLFIGIGPIFSGLAVTVLALFLCFPDAWRGYLAVSQSVSADGTAAGEIVAGIFSLFLSLPAAIAQAPWRAILGLLVLLAVSLHISLSLADIRGSLSALPFYLILTLLFAAVTFLLKWNGAVEQFLRLWNVRLLSLFSLVIAFCLVWILLAVLVRAVQKLLFKH